MEGKDIYFNNFIVFRKLVTRQWYFARKAETRTNATKITGWMQRNKMDFKFQSTISDILNFVIKMY